MFIVLLQTLRALYVPTVPHLPATSPLLPCLPHHSSWASASRPMPPASAFRHSSSSVRCRSIPDWGTLITVPDWGTLIPVPVWDTLIPIPDWGTLIPLPESDTLIPILWYPYSGTGLDTAGAFF